MFGGNFVTVAYWKCSFPSMFPQSGQQQWKKKISPSPSRPAAALISFQCGASYFGSLPDRPVLCFWRILVYHLFLQLGASGTGCCLWICGDTKPPKTFRRYSWCSPFRIYPSKRPSASGVHGCLDSELQVLLALELRRNQSICFDMTNSFWCPILSIKNSFSTCSLTATQLLEHHHPWLVRLVLLPWVPGLQKIWF